MTDVAGRLTAVAKILKALALSAIFGVVIFYCAVFAWKALLWALPDMPWTRHAPRDHVSASAPVLASANTMAATPKSEPIAVSNPPISSSNSETGAEIPTKRAELPTAVPTTVTDPASKLGMGELWLNVCGNSRTGYRMCRGSVPTDAQRAADFPPGAKDL